MRRDEFVNKKVEIIKEKRQCFKEKKDKKRKKLG